MWAAVVPDADRILMRLVEGGSIADRLGVEHRDVSISAFGGAPRFRVPDLVGAIEVMRRLASSSVRTFKLADMVGFRCVRDVP